MRVFFGVYFLPKSPSLSEFIFVRSPILQNLEFNFIMFLLFLNIKIKINNIGVYTCARFKRMHLYQIIFLSMDLALAP